MFGLSFSKSYPLNKIYLSKDRLIGNYQLLSNLNQGVQVAPVLKSNAYGHGIKEVGKIIDTQNPPFICVDSLYEAIQLKKAGVKSEILIMGYIDPRSLKGKKLPFSYAVYDSDQIKAVKNAQPQAKMHLFIDTGMHREGLRIFRGGHRGLKWLKDEGIEFEGMMSHFAMPRKADSALTKKQINNFKIAKKAVLQAGFRPKWFHIGGTYSLTNHLTSEVNLVRCGKGVYGFGDPKLQPILSLSTTIIQWKEIGKGDPVGYDATFIAPKKMLLAVLPIGYNDGVDRRLSNKGSLRIKSLIRGLEYDLSQAGSLYADCPIVGRVSMNLTVIDMTEAYNKLGSKMPYVGAQIEVISNNPENPNSIQNIADVCQTIPEEILVHLHPSTKREII